MGKERNESGQGGASWWVLSTQEGKKSSRIKQGKWFCFWDSGGGQQRAKEQKLTPKRHFPEIAYGEGHTAG